MYTLAKIGDALFKVSCSLLFWVFFFIFLGSGTGVMGFNPLPEPRSIGEVGIANGVTGVWQTVSLQQTYNNPVVIAGAPTYNSTEPATVRVQNVTGNSFELRIDEWECLDQTVGGERVPYIVVEAGRHWLPNGKRLIAANLSDITSEWVRYAFPEALRTEPIVLGQIITENEAEAATVRFDHEKTNARQAQLRLLEAGGGAHIGEEVSLLVIEPGVQNGINVIEAGNTGIVVDEVIFSLNFEQTYGANPVFIGGMGTNYGIDAAAVRYQNLNGTGVEVFVEEESCSDEEILHTFEEIHYLVFDGAGPFYSAAELGDNQSPSIPQNLISTLITDSSATISWDPSVENGEFVGYNIYQNGVALPLAKVTDGSTSVTIEGLFEFTSYEFSVQAFDASGNTSGQSAFLPVTIDGTCPKVTLYQDDFERGEGIWVVETEPNPINGKPGSFRSSSVNGAYSGNFSMALQGDHDKSYFTSRSLDLSAYNELLVEFTLRPLEYFNNFDGVQLQISTDGGTSFSVVKEWVIEDGTLVNSRRIFEQVRISGPFSSETQVRFSAIVFNTRGFAPAYFDDIKLMVCKLESCSETSNLALGRTARMSSVQGVSTAGLGVDGNPFGSTPLTAEADLVHTTIEAQPWWEVDLGVQSQVDFVRIYNRSDCCQEKLRKFYVLVSDTPMEGDLASLLVDPNVASVYYPFTMDISDGLPVNAEGRYVRIQLSETDPLHFAEVEVYGCALGNLPTTCEVSVADITVSHPTSCITPNGSIQIEATGTNLEFSIDGGNTFQIANSFSSLGEGYYDVVVREQGDETCLDASYVQLENPLGCNPYQCIDPGNVALNKPVSVSSQFGDGSLGVVVDGDTLGFTPFEPGADMVQTDTADDNSWIEVDLLDLYQLQEVVLFPNSFCCPEQLQSFSILVSELPFDTASTAEALALLPEVTAIEFDGAAAIGGGTRIALPDSTLGRYVRIHNRDSSYLALAEMFVMGCLADTSPECVINIDSVLIAEISDCGLEDGVIEILATGDSAAYSIDGGTSFQASNVFLGLAPGVYPLMVKKVGLDICFETDTVAILEPVPPSISNIVSTDPSGCDQLDGSISISASGDSLEYSIDGGGLFQDSGLFSGLNQGIYDIVVREKERNACLVTDVVALNVVTNFTIDTVWVGNPSDCGEADGRVEVETTGENLQYSIDGGITYQDTNVFVDLAANTYVLTVREENQEECILAEVITLLAPDQPIIDSLTVTDPATCADNSGSVEVSARGTNLQYSINGGVSYQSSPRFNNLIVGTYEIRVREAGRPACITVQEVSLEAPNPTEILELVGVPPSDCGLEDGSITISGNADNLVYSIDGGISFQRINLFIGLAEGNYNIVVQPQGAEQCKVSDSFTLSGPKAPVLDSVNLVLPTDCEAVDGAISVFGTGDSLEYSIDGGISFSDTNFFPGLPPVGFNIIIREVGSLTCMAEDSLTLVPANLPVFTSVIAVNPSDCGLSDGSISIDATGSNMEYSINGGLSYQDSNFFGSLDSGQYVIVVREVGSLTCINTDTVNLVAPTIPLINSLLVSQPSDCGLDDGRIIVVATGDSLEYSYDGGLSFTASDTLSGLPGGTYNLVVREAGTLSCRAQNQVVLDSLVLPVISSLELINPSDCEGMDGEIEILAMGDSLEYSLDSGFTYSETPLFSGLISGKYDIVVREIGSATCWVRDTATLVDPALPALDSIWTTHPTDCGVENGTISLVARGDSLEYSIDNGLSYTNTPSFQGLNRGTYIWSLRPQASANCVISDTVVLVGPDIPEIQDITSSQPTDCDLEDGTIQITADGATLEYSIDSGATFQNTGFFRELPTGRYQIRVREAGTENCYATAQVDLFGPSNPELVQIEFLDPQGCGTQDGAIDIVALGQNVSYSINGGMSFQFSNLFPNLRAGTYNIVVRDPDFPTCTVDTTITLTDSIWCGQITCVEPTNVAFGKTVSSSGSSTSTELGVDGIIEGNTVDGPAPELVVLNARTDSLEPYYDINLGSIHNLERIRVYPRANCCPEDLQDFFVLVSPRPFGSSLLTDVLADTSIHKFQYIGNTTGAMPIEFVLPEGSIGQYVRLTHPSSDRMVFAEMEVIGCGLSSPQFFLYSAGDTSQLVNPDPLSLVEIYPNPFRSNFTIDLGRVDSEVAVVRMINALGQVVYATTLSTQRILQIGNNLSPGMYWVEIEYATQSEQFKILKMR